MDKLSEFEFDGNDLKVNFIESTVVKPGVVCDIYLFEDDDTRDLALIRVDKGVKTPLQKVLKGVSTIEGYFSGEGILSVENSEGKLEYTFPNEYNKPIKIELGSLMQWSASDKTDLVIYEICHRHMRMVDLKMLTNNSLL